MGSVQYQFMENPSVNGWFASGDHFSMLMMYPQHWWLQLRNHVIRSCISLDDTRIRWIFFRPFPNLPSAQSTFGHKCLGYDRSSSPEKGDSQVPHVETPGNDQQCMLAVATPFRFRSSRGPLFASWPIRSMYAIYGNIYHHINISQMLVYHTWILWVMETKTGTQRHQNMRIRQF